MHAFSVHCQSKNSARILSESGERSWQTLYWHSLQFHVHVVDLQWRESFLEKVSHRFAKKLAKALERHQQHLVGALCSVIIACDVHVMLIGAKLSALGVRIVTLIDAPAEEVANRDPWQALLSEEVSKPH